MGYNGRTKKSEVDNLIVVYAELPEGIEKVMLGEENRLLIINKEASIKEPEKEKETA